MTHEITTTLTADDVENILNALKRLPMSGPRKVRIDALIERLEQEAT